MQVRNDLYSDPKRPQTFDSWVRANVHTQSDAAFSGLSDPSAPNVADPGSELAPLQKDIASLRLSNASMALKIKAYEKRFGPIQAEGNGHGQRERQRDREKDGERETDSGACLQTGRNGESDSEREGTGRKRSDLNTADPVDRKDGQDRQLDVARRMHISGPTPNASADSGDSACLVSSPAGASYQTHPSGAAAASKSGEKEAATERSALGTQTAQTHTGGLPGQPVSIGN